MIKNQSDRTIKRMALIIAVIASFLTPFMGSAVNVALPTIGKEFNADAIMLSWVATAYLLSAAVFLLPFGRIADIYGRKKIFLFGIIIFTVSSLLCAFSNTIILLIVFRLFQAIGSSMIFGTGIAILTSVFPPGERGAAMGITVASVYIGLSLGPWLGGILTEHLGWRSIFYIIFPIGVLVVFLIINKLKSEWVEAKGEKVDWTGSVLYGASLVLLIYGLSMLPDLSGAIMIGVSIGGLIIFIKHELKVTHPVLEVRLFIKNRVFGYSNLAALINYSATFAVAFLLSFYLQNVKGFTPAEAGTILVAQPIVMAVFSPFMGRLSDKFEPNIIASIGMAITTAGLCCLVFLTQTSSIPAIVGILIVLGLGFAFFSSPNTNAIMSSVEKRYYGIASGTVNTMRILGQMFSMGIAMLLFALFIGKEEMSIANQAQFLNSIRTAFIIFATLCFLGTFASLARGKVR